MCVIERDLVAEQIEPVSGSCVCVWMDEVYQVLWGPEHMHLRRIKMKNMTGDKL